MFLPSLSLSLLHTILLIVVTTTTKQAYELVTTTTMTTTTIEKETVVDDDVTYHTLCRYIYEFQSILLLVVSTQATNPSQRHKFGFKFNYHIHTRQVPSQLTRLTN